MFAVERIDHVEVFVSDLERAAAWYRRVLGLEEVARWDPEPVMIAAGGTKLALFRRAAPAGPSEASAGWHRVAWLVDGDHFEEAQRHLHDQGIPFRGPMDHGKAWSIYFADPDGNRLEITTYDVRAE